MRSNTLKRLRLILILTLTVILLTVSAASAQDSTIDPALNEQLDSLVAITERLRDLDTLEPVERAFPTRQETIDYLTDLYNSDLPAEEMERAQLLYVALDLLPEDIDLREVYLNLLGSQVAGFYDPDTRVMNVIPTIGDNVGEELSLTERIVFVHEYTHALQDQHFGLTMLDDERLQAAPDRSLAALALVEGDATATMQVYAQEIVMRNPAAAFQLLAEGAMAGNLMLPEGVPPILVSELMFPYEAGLDFVVALYNDGGWARINAAYDNLPQTTEQILHPEKYLTGEIGQTVAAPDLMPGDGWNPVWDISLGEFYLAQYLHTQLPTTAANRAAAGWGGDRFQLYVDPETDARVWSLHISWDTPDDAAEFAEAFAQFGAEKFGSTAENACWSDGDGALCFIDAVANSTGADSTGSDNGGSLIVSAPTLAMAQSLLAQVEAAP